MPYPGSAGWRVSSHRYSTDGCATANGAELLPAGFTRTRHCHRCGDRERAERSSYEEQPIKGLYAEDPRIMAAKRALGPVRRRFSGDAKLKQASTSPLWSAASCASTMASGGSSGEGPVAVPLLMLGPGTCNTCSVQRVGSQGTARILQMHTKDEGLHGVNVTKRFVHSSRKGPVGGVEPFPQRQMTTTASSLYVGFLTPLPAQHDREELACSSVSLRTQTKARRVLLVNLVLSLAGMGLFAAAVLTASPWVSDELRVSTATALRGIGRQLRHRPVLPSWVLAALLYISSSTDNFAVGASVALSGSPHSVYVNGVIAVCNASAALVSAAFGTYLGDAAPTVAPMAAAAIFLYLAYEEVCSLIRGEDASPLAQMAVSGLAWRLAVPMSINNLAGGIASGVAGIGPLEAGFWALVASYAMFRLGHYLGDNLGRFIEGCLDPRVLAATIFTIVAMLQLHDAELI